MSANLRAFLALIRTCEVGTVGEEGYCKIVGGGSFGSWDDHPRILREGVFHNGKAWKSTAAGGYQFLSSTWDECKAALNLPDFSPASQDQAAIYLIKRRNALHAVEEGDLRNAIWLCNKEWASLPGSPYGQPQKSYADCERIFISAGGTLSQAASGPPQASSPSPAAAPPAPTIGERIVAIPALVTAAASALIPIIADLMRARGSKTSERNADVVENVAPVIVEVARQIVPAAKNEQEAAETILSDKSLQDAFKGAMAVRWKDVEPFLTFEEESREKARGFAEKMTATDGPAWRQIGFGVLIGIMSLTIVVGGGAMFWNLMSSPQLDPGQKGLILGALIASFTTVVGYFFGSSATSRQKDQTISEQAKGK